MKAPGFAERMEAFLQNEKDAGNTWPEQEQIFLEVMKQSKLFRTLLDHNYKIGLTEGSLYSMFAMGYRAGLKTGDCFVKDAVKQ